MSATTIQSQRSWIAAIYKGSLAMEIAVSGMVVPHVSRDGLCGRGHQGKVEGAKTLGRDVLAITVWQGMVLRRTQQIGQGRNKAGMGDEGTTGLSGTQKEQGETGQSLGCSLRGFVGSSELVHRGT
jgi:hypothetical protein